MVNPAKGEPRPCVNNAHDESGWCGLHFTSEIERQRRTAKQAVITEELNARIESHIAMSAADPWWWLKHITPSRDAERGLQPYSKTSPKIVKLLRNGPHRVG